MGHTANDPRINVAISRAQELLVIIGNRRFIEENRKKAGKMYKIVQHLDKKGCILYKSFFGY
jgi:superfamily I DNA and/or RNA helicase